ncbi:MAG: alanine--tRNA ligase, partial [Candidatus Shapirobacteria bacterium]
MTAADLKAKFVEFFKQNGHIEIPSASLIPENDPTTLFISAGIQPLVPYFLGRPHPVGKRLVNVQKCVRTGDIDEVGDEVHHTFFEMLGNWSLGDYFKTDMIPMSFEFLTKTLNIPISNLAVTCFEGDSNAPKDIETATLWKKLGIPPTRIAYLPKANNWWGPPGVTGPCGTDTEMFYWTGSDTAPQVFDPDDKRWVEIWNDVLIQYFKNEAGDYEKLVQNNIDTGMGVERTTAILNGFADNYLTDIWQPIIKTIESLKPGISYLNTSHTVPLRIVADHLRAATFIVADGLEPGNKEAGYVLRRLIRRAIRQAIILGIDTNFTPQVVTSIINNRNNMGGDYTYLDLDRERIISVISTEEKKFRQTLTKGLTQIQKLIKANNKISGQQAFDIYQSFGFPLEMIQEELKLANITLNVDEFNRAKEEHISQSRTLSAGKFRSGLVDNSEITTKYHTATHLLHAALRKILGTHVQQVGSNITSERLRFDFTHPEKLTPAQIDEVETEINQVIKSSYP